MMWKDPFLIEELREREFCNLRVNSVALTEKYSLFNFSFVTNYDRKFWSFHIFLQAQFFVN